MNNRTFSLWIRRLWSSLAECLTACVCIIAGYTITLAFFRMLWALYCETQVCQKFIQKNPDLFHLIDSVVTMNSLYLSCTASLLALKACLLIAATAQLTMIKSLLYDPRGFIGKRVLFGIPCTYVAALDMTAVSSFVAFLICLLPALTLMNYCFKLAAVALPDLGYILKRAFR